MRRSQASFRFPIKGGRLFLSGHNPLMRAGYRGTIGLKTGYTDEAGLCFVGVVRAARPHAGGGAAPFREPGAARRAKLLDAAFAGARSLGGEHRPCAPTIRGEGP